MSWRVIEGDGRSAVVDLPEAVDGGPGGAIVAAAGPEPELVDGIGQSPFLRVVGRDPGLDDVQAAQAFLDGPLPPGAVHALAGVVHVDAVVHHELDLAVDADLVRMLEDMLAGAILNSGREMLTLKKGRSQSKCSLQASISP